MQQSTSSSARSSVLDFFQNSQFLENPFTALAQLRSQGSVIALPFAPGASQQAWMVTRMEEAVHILKDHRRFTVDPASINSQGFFGPGGDANDNTPHLFRRSMISVDEPAHMRLRSLVSKAFTPKYIQGLRPRIQQLADELLDKVQAQGQMDLVHDYAYPLPINVISEMLGVPVEQRDQIREWSQDLVGGPTTRDEDQQDRIQNFMNYITQLVAEKRRQPGEDLISQLIQIEESNGDSLNETELLSMIGLLIFAGHETTSNLIGIGTLTLFDHPEQFARLKADLSLVPSTVEELLRFNGPVLIPAPRFATEDTEIGGQNIKKGDFLMIVLGSANRDEGQFNDAGELDIARQLNRHIAFGQGIHVCLGAPLARLEGDIAFTTLLQRMPDLRLNAPRESITWRGGGISLRGLTSLPVAF